MLTAQPIEEVTNSPEVSGATRNSNHRSHFYNLHASCNFPLGTAGIRMVDEVAAIK